MQTSRTASRNDFRHRLRGTSLNFQGVSQSLHALVFSSTLTARLKLFDLHDGSANFTQNYSVRISQVRKDAPLWRRIECDTEFSRCLSVSFSLGTSGSHRITLISNGTVAYVQLSRRLGHYPFLLRSDKLRNARELTWSTGCMYIRWENYFHLRYCFLLIDRS